MASKMPNKQQAKTGVLYLSLIVSAIIWLGSDIFFLIKLTDIKKEEADQTESSNCIKKSEGSVINWQVFLIIFLLMMEFVFKYKLSSYLGSFASKSSNLVVILITGILVLPTFLSYNVAETYKNKDFSLSTLNALITFHVINLILKTIIIVSCFLPNLKTRKFIEFFKSTSMHYTPEVKEN